MNLHLTWDLFILVFFAVIIAYSFIIGRNRTLKIIVGTYLSILCADGVGNIFAKYFASSPTFLKFLSFFTVGSEAQAVTIFKVLLFLILIVLIAVRGVFEVDAEDDQPFSIRFAILFCLGILSGGLMMSAVLVFVSGGSLVGSPGTNSLITEIYQNSRLVRIMIDFANVWFFLPGLVFIGMGLWQKKSA